MCSTFGKLVNSYHANAHRKEAQHFEEVASFQEEIEEQLSEIIQEYTLKARQILSINMNCTYSESAVMCLCMYCVGLISLLHVMQQSVEIIHRLMLSYCTLITVCTVWTFSA